MRAFYKKHLLKFNFEAQTSREILKQKETYILTLEDKKKTGIGECALFKGLSIDNEAEYENKLQWTCENIHFGFEKLYSELIDFPSIQFGLEQAFNNLTQKKDIYFPSKFTHGEDSILINGLIWMGDFAMMKSQIEEKINQNFLCIKIKIGHHNWQNEFELLQELRQNFTADKLEIRVDANGSFSYSDAKKVLEQLAQLGIHSIEQPIKKGQIDAMSDLCKHSPTPIALDEELSGILYAKEKIKLLKKINPQFIILKPSLLGGFSGCEEWIDIANNLNINWWITSSLESNIGLNALAQWTYLLNNPMPQGLGTGNLFLNNFPSSLKLVGDKLYFNQVP